MSKTIAELAAEAFDANERVKMLEMMNTPSEYDKRKAAFIELVEARVKAEKLNRELSIAPFVCGDVPK